MSADERVEFEEALGAAGLALEEGEKVRDTREAAGLTRRDLVGRMSTSRAAVARLKLAARAPRSRPSKGSQQPSI